MTGMLHDEAIALVRKHRDLKLTTQRDYTRSVPVAVDHDRGYECTLMGPFTDTDNPKDVRIWLQYRVLDNMATIDIMVQDTDDDAWLNSNADGAERYRAAEAIYLEVPSG